MLACNPLRLRPKYAPGGHGYFCDRPWTRKNKCAWCNMQASRALVALTVMRCSGATRRLYFSGVPQVGQTRAGITSERSGRTSPTFRCPYMQALGYTGLSLCGPASKEHACSGGDLRHAGNRKDRGRSVPSDVCVAFLPPLLRPVQETEVHRVQ